jgi:deoxyribodipyrimidine photo-lyase
MPTPALRVSASNDAPVRADRAFVLYWMIAARRTAWSHAFDRAVERARELGKPLVVLEALSCDYPWASARLHRFVLDGMADNARALARRPALYHPYVEPEPGAGRGLVRALAAHAAVIVTDDFPTFVLASKVRAVSRGVDVRVERVDSNGLLPMRAATTVFPTALAFRRYLQRSLADHLACPPVADALARATLPRLDALPRDVLERWPAADRALLGGDPSALSRLPIDHRVEPVEPRGGAVAADERLARFLDGPLDRYADERNDLDRETTSGLSPYLHFGHISVHRILAALAAREAWSASSLSRRALGQREGFWGLSPSIEAFLDQLVTWREVGLNFSALRADHDRYESLPEWARATLDRHRGDPRPWLYDRDALDEARTHDPLWNAAQTQLRREGRIHNYLRMLWGKKILEWSASPEVALRTLIELNDRYALDGRDPNSYTGIFWTLGRYDRPWAPERPIFGRIRYMSSENTARKLGVRGYLQRWGQVSGSGLRT